MLMYWLKKIDMKFEAILDSLRFLREQEAAPVADAGTTYAEDIAFLPSGFITPKKKKKRKEDLEKSLGVEVLDKELSESERTQQDLVSLYRDIEKALSGLKDKYPLRDVLESITLWKRAFPYSYYGPGQYPVFINLTDKEDYVKIGLDRIKGETSLDEFGQLERIEKAIRKQDTLAQFELFDEYDRFIEAFLQVLYQGVRLIYIIFINKGWVVSSMIHINDKDVIDALDEFASVRTTSQGYVFPVGTFFRRDFFSSLKDIIDDI